MATPMSSKCSEVVVFMDAVPKVPSLKRIRESHFLTQLELAEKSGVHRVTIANLEGGQEEARFSTIRKLAAALGVPPSDLVRDAA